MFGVPNRPCNPFGYLISTLYYSVDMFSDKYPIVFQYTMCDVWSCEPVGPGQRSLSGVVRVPSKQQCTSFGVSIVYS